MHFNAIVLQVEEAFGQSWNFHHACGALVRKHIAIKAPDNSGTLFITTMAPPPPNNSGTLFHNYDGFFLIFSPS